MFRNPLTDTIVALIVVILIFGPKRLPLVGKSLGHGLREFKDSITNRSDPDEAEQPALMPAQASATPPAQAAPSAQAPSQQ